MNLIQLDHSIFAIAREPIKHPDVGTIRLVNASPKLECNYSCLTQRTPNRSDSGAMIGIVMAACPVRDTTKKLNTDWWIDGFISLWLHNWMISWAFAFPIVLTLLPFVRKLTSKLVDIPPPSTEVKQF